MVRVRYRNVHSVLMSPNRFLAIHVRDYTLGPHLSQDLPKCP